MFVILVTNNWLAIGAAISIAIFVASADVCAYNPAVAIALAYAGKLPQTDLIPYVVAEVAGALVAVELVKFVVNRKA